MYGQGGESIWTHSFVHNKVGPFSFGDSSQHPTRARAQVGNRMNSHFPAFGDAKDTGALGVRQFDLGFGAIIAYGQ